MISLKEASEIAAIVSAMADVVSFGKEQFNYYLGTRSRAPDFEARGKQLQHALQTYSDDEIAAIKERLAHCAAQFIAEGNGKARRTCLCSVLTNVKDGNGGELPFPDWEDLYRQMKCAAATTFAFA